MFVLMVMVVIITVTWPENYGDKSSDFSKSFKKALTAIRTGMLLYCSSKRSVVYTLIFL
jgi:hypothetical protein